MLEGKAGQWTSPGSDSEELSQPDRGEVVLFNQRSLENGNTSRNESHSVCSRDGADVVVFELRPESQDEPVNGDCANAKAIMMSYPRRMLDKG